MWNINIIVILPVILMNTSNVNALPEENSNPKIPSEIINKVTSLIRDYLHISKDENQNTAVIGLINIITSAVKGQQAEEKRKALRRNVVRRYSGHKPILGVPQYPEDLPAAEPILPGHTLLRPSKGMLKSAVKYPLRDFGGAVYGNLDNLGITYGKTRDRIRYSNFRKANNIMAALKNAVQNRKQQGNKMDRPLIIIEIDPSNLGVIKGNVIKDNIENQVSNEDNDASEVLDDLDALLAEDSKDPNDLRRKSKSNYRDRDKYYDKNKKRGSDVELDNIVCSGSDAKSESTSSESEDNPGNPYTIHKNKYKQNWMWNHYMDGDHMNINPYAPAINELEPTGAKLFFGRKWWYFNQDDYLPMRRR